MSVADIDPSAVAGCIASALGLAAAGGDLPVSAPVFFGFRRGGVLRCAQWSCVSTLRDAIAAERGSVLRPGDADAVEICLSGAYRVVAPVRWRKRFANRYRGIDGIAISLGSDVERYAPTQTIATNRSFDRVFEHFLGRHGLTEGEFISEGGVIERFAARQYLVRLTPRVHAVRMYRGNRVVATGKITRETLGEMIHGMGGWLLRNLGSDGRLPYKYWPSRGEYSGANNTIRQFLATISLGRLARFTAREDIREAARRNLACNLGSFFRVHDGIGVIEHAGSAKLGAAALAALALLEHPEPGAYHRELGLLQRGIESLWNPDGSFRTFHRPRDRNDNQNFYPGEALLFWAALYAHTSDGALLSRCARSFEFYRKWHLSNRNPAFVPWHTQACALLYAQTGEERYKAFLLEMNDWLLGMQQWESAPCPDLRGRFYDPAHPAYGPSHASSTGVYLEGLADAYRIAHASGDSARAQAYRDAIWRGLRNIRQLQFVDEVDMYYISRRERVRGAVRTEAYHNELRIDNVAHPLAALLKLAADPSFH